MNRVVSKGLATYVVVPEVWLMVLGGVEQVVESSTTSTLLVMWRFAWMHEASSWARGAKRGLGGQAGGH